MYRRYATLLAAALAALLWIGCGDSNSNNQKDDVPGVCAANQSGNSSSSTFTCGNKSCEVGGEYCEATTGGAAGPNGQPSISYACKSLPGSCSADECCTCIMDKRSSGSGSASCSKAGPGRYSVSVALP